jgi:uncharacterized integral membrane protein
MLVAMSAGWPGAGSGTPDGDPELGHPPGIAHVIETRRGAKAIVAALVLLALVLFVVRNSQKVSVDFIVTKGHFRLIWVIVICSILGGLVGFLLGRPTRLRRHRSGRSKAGSGDGDLPKA